MPGRVHNHLVSSFSSPGCICIRSPCSLFLLNRNQIILHVCKKIPPRVQIRSPTLFFASARSVTCRPRYRIKLLSCRGPSVVCRLVVVVCFPGRLFTPRGCLFARAAAERAGVPLHLGRRRARYWLLFTSTCAFDTHNTQHAAERAQQNAGALASLRGNTPQRASALVGRRAL